MSARGKTASEELDRALAVLKAANDRFRQSMTAKNRAAAVAAGTAVLMAGYAFRYEQADEDRQAAKTARAARRAGRAAAESRPDLFGPMS